MILIYGTHRFGLKKIAVRKDFCNACERECVAEQLESFDCGHFFYIPILPLGTKQRWHCSLCGKDPTARYKTSNVIRILGIFALPFMFVPSWLNPDPYFDNERYGMTAIFGGAWLWLLYSTFKGQTGPTEEESRAAVTPLSTTECLYCGGPVTLHPFPRCPSCRIRIYGGTQPRPTQSFSSSRPPPAKPPPVPAIGSRKKCEDQMAEWLAHPNEFGTFPESVRHKRTYQGDVMGHGDVEIHLIDYVMPDGKQGRGFVNDSLTWSFLGDGVNALDDDNLILAYCGWMWLFPAMQSGSVVTNFVSEGEEARYLAQKQQQGLTDVTITNRYKFGTSELFEFTCNYQGTPGKGAGDTSHDVGFLAGDPRCNLPSIYFFIGQQVIKSMR